MIEKLCISCDLLNQTSIIEFNGKSLRHNYFCVSIHELKLTVTDIYKFYGG